MAMRTSRPYTGSSTSCSIHDPARGAGPGNELGGRRRTRAGLLAVPAGFLRAAGGARCRPDRRTHGRDADARPRQRAARVLDRPCTHLDVPAVDRPHRCRAAVRDAPATRHRQRRAQFSGGDDRHGGAGRADLAGHLPARPERDDRCRCTAHPVSTRTRPLSREERRHHVDRYRRDAALFLRHARMAPQHRDAGAGTRACVAGAHPSALPVQQHEHDRLADAHGSRAGRGSRAGSRRPVPRQPVRQAHADHAERRARSRHHLRTHRETAHR